MMDMFTEHEALAAIPRLTRLRLTTFVEARIVVPLQAEAGPVFRRIDLARIELLCELAEEFDLDADALSLMMSLLDQLHATRRDLKAIAAAVAAESPEVRARIGAALARDG
jgi:chaperone modulatory protein CbpM